MTPTHLRRSVSPGCSTLRSAIVPLAAAVLALVHGGGASADDLAGASAPRGKTLVEKSCASCHATLYGGDATRMYLRPDRKVNTLPKLIARVKTCNVNTGAGWKPQDELDAAAYLNESFYRFK
jgi:hypothetical protein